MKAPLSKCNLSKLERECCCTTSALCWRAGMNCTAVYTLCISATSNCDRVIKLY